MRFSIVLLASLLYFSTGCANLPGGTRAAASPVWTGFFASPTVDVSPEVSGRILSVAVDEGSEITAGQTLLTLDDDMVRAKIEIADARVASAQAQLSLVEAGARAEELAKARARVDQARAAVDAATQVVSDTEAIRANPQMLLALQAQAQVRVQGMVDQEIVAVKQAQAADVMSKFWEDQVRGMEEGTDIKLPGGESRHFSTPALRLDFARNEWNKASHDAWLSWTAVDQVRANRTTAEAGLGDVVEQLARPQALDARVDQARGARDRAAANLLQAQAALQALAEGPSPAQVRAARAALETTQAARASLDKELAKYKIAAPQAGTVTTVYYRPGEIALATVPVVRLRVAGDLKLRVFVPISQLAQVHIGDIVPVTVPDLSNQSVTGTVTNIADRAEFTARQAQTDNERNAQLVAIEIAVKNPIATLKAGIPASVSFGGGGNGAVIAAPVGDAVSGDTGALHFSGSLEARQTRVSAELGGRVTAVSVQKGDAVKLGDPLITLDDSTIQSARAEAESGVRTAQAGLDQALETARAGTLALAQAGLSQAEADVQAAQLALANANRAVENPQDLNSQVHTWESKVAGARADIERAQASLDAVKTQVDAAANDMSQSGKARLAVLQKQQEAAEAALTAAQNTLNGDVKVLDQFKRMAPSPLELQAAKHAAAAQLQVAFAGVAVARADLVIAQRGPQPEAVALAQAALGVAQANLKQVETQARRMALASTVIGTVIDRTVESGETVRPAAPLLTIADTSQLELRIYLPVRNIGAVKLGQAGVVTLPSLPGKSYEAHVTYIAPEAEFKPANIYNSQERSEIVFAVKVTLTGATAELKAGLPADVSLR